MTEGTGRWGRGSHGLRVVAVDTFLVDAAWRNYLFVKITTDQGIVGWGEATLGWKEGAVEALIRDYADRYVIGMDPFHIEDLWFTLYQVEHNLGPVMYAAMAGIELALWDVVGKACGQPVVNLNGGPLRDRVKAYANGWYPDVGDLGLLREAAERVLAKGYLALKFDPFGAGGREISYPELRSACAAVGEVRDAVGPDVDLLIECHGRFSVGMAIEAIRAMTDYRPLFCEEPVPAQNHQAQAEVTRAAASVGARVATGEHCYGRSGFLDLLARGGAHVVQPDLVYSGGFSETKVIAALAEAHYVSVAPHNCDGDGRLAASVHLCAGIPNFLILESFADFDVDWRNDLVISRPEFRDGYYILPDAPGWGFEVDEEVARAHPGSTKARMNMFSEGWERQMSANDPGSTATTPARV